MTISAIPTTYRAVRYRSRLEARWAAFFDEIGWRHEYEPLDLAGWIPDFALQFPAGELLVEVKPVFSWPDIQPAVLQKIAGSGWDREVLIVGVAPFSSSVFDCSLSCGWLGETASRHRPWNDGSRHVWGEARLFRCDSCHQPSLHHCDQSYHCRVNGCYDGDHHLGGDDSEAFRVAWAQAGNATRWQGR